MGMRIRTNVSSLIAQRFMENNNDAMKRSYERLSSGYRINRSADDAAGLAVSENIRGKVRGLNQAKRNAKVSEIFQKNLPGLGDLPAEFEWKIEKVKVDDLAPKSYTFPAIVDEKKKLIEEGTKLPPIMVNKLPGEDLEILDGNHRIQALREMGVKETEVLFGRLKR